MQATVEPHATSGAIFGGDGIGHPRVDLYGESMTAIHNWRRYEGNIVAVGPTYDPSIAERTTGAAEAPREAQS